MYAIDRGCRTLLIYRCGTGAGAGGRATPGAVLGAAAGGADAPDGAAAGRAPPVPTAAPTGPPGPAAPGRCGMFNPLPAMNGAGRPSGGALPGAGGGLAPACLWSGISTSVIRLP